MSRIFLLILCLLQAHIMAHESFSACFKALKEQGYFELANPYLSNRDFRELYREYDHFIDLMTEDEHFFQQMRASEKDFFAHNDLQRRYCGTPPSYRDPAKDPSKKRAKIYFQFIKEHMALVKEKYPEEFARCASFFDGMSKIDQMANSLFLKLIDALEEGCPGIKAALFETNDELTIVTKIVRYKKSDQWGTTAHFDKSALSLVWDSTDPDHDSLVICPDVASPCLEKLIKPTRKYGYDSGLNSIIVLPGACLCRVNLPIQPTLHGVLPLVTEYRHAIISFALIPGLDTKDIVTDFDPALPRKECFSKKK